MALISIKGTSQYILMLLWDDFPAQIYDGTCDHLMSHEYLFYFLSKMHYDIYSI